MKFIFPVGWIEWRHCHRAGTSDKTRRHLRPIGHDHGQPVTPTKPETVEGCDGCIAKVDEISVRQGCPTRRCNRNGSARLALNE